jgi:hypothetical protein
MIRLTEAELKATLASHEVISDTGATDMRKTEAHRATEAAKPNKLRNIPTEIDGIRFASKSEAKRYIELKTMERAGLISDLRLQPIYKLFDKFTDKFGRKHRAAAYVGDFAYTKDGHAICEDVKGHPTSVFALKWKLAIRAYPDVRFEVVK